MFSWIRHSPRHALVLFAIAAALLSIGVILSYPVLTTRPNPSIDYIAQLNEMVARDQPLGENAWDDLRALIVDGLGRDGDMTVPPGPSAVAANSFAASSQLLRGSWDAANRTADIATLRSFDDLLEQLAATAAKPAFHAPYVHQGNALTGELDASNRQMLYDSLLLPWLGPARRLVSLNTQAMRVDAAEGRWEDFVLRVETGVAIGDGVMRQASLIEQLVGYSIMVETCVEAVRSSYECDPPAPVMRRVIDILENCDWSRIESTHRWVEAERFHLIDFIQWSYSDDGDGNGLLTSMGPFLTMSGGPGTGQSPVTNSFFCLYGLFEADRAQAERRINERFAKIKELSLQGTLDKRKFDQILSDDAGTDFVSMVLYVFLPALDRAVRHGQMLESSLHGWRLALLLKLHERESGAWRESLLDVVTESDATDPVSGKLFDYVRTPDDASGRPIQLFIPWMDRTRPDAEILMPRELLLAETLGVDSNQE